MERLLVIGPPENLASYGEHNYRCDMTGRSLTGCRFPLGRVSAAVLFPNLRPTGSIFVSRGDESLVHRVERTLWGERGPHEDSRWYMETGEGMAATLRMASVCAIVGKWAYTLTDEATFLSLRSELDFHVVLGADPALEIAVTAVPTAKDAGKAAVSRRFVVWLKSAEAKAIIRGFTVSGVRPFCPSGESTKWTHRGRLDPAPEPEEKEEQGAE